MNILHEFGIFPEPLNRDCWLSSISTKSGCEIFIPCNSEESAIETKNKLERLVKWQEK